VWQASRVRWDALFADLEAQLDAAYAEERTGEVAERTRREVGRLRLVDRLRAARGREVVVRLQGAGALQGRVADVGADWVLLEEPGGGAALLALATVLVLSGTGPRSEQPGSEGEVERRFDLRFALRKLVRDRTVVDVTLVDGTLITGTLDRVAADHVELAQHARDEPRRAAAVRQVLLLPVAAVALVRPVL
jgi:hypothetical protein